MPADVWSAGDLYEPYVGRWSRQVAPRFLDWLGREPDCRWLDIGCGTGALSGQIAATCEPRLVLGLDPSLGFVEYARAAVRGDRVGFGVGDALALPVVADVVDYVVSGLVLNFVSDIAGAAAEQCRVCRPGGMVGAYVWDYAEGMQLMRYFWDAAIALDPRASELDEARRFPGCHPEALAGAFRAAGLDRVETTGIVIPTIFRDFDDYWTPFLGGQAPAPGYCMSLDDAARTRLRDALRAALPRGADGSIPLTARAWAVRGVTS